jgi:hypothetical protein
MEAGTDAAGITPALTAAAWASMAAASVAGIALGRVSAVAGCASAREDSMTAGRVAVVAAIIGRLCLGGCFGELVVVMGKVLFSAANAVGQARVTNDTSVTGVIFVKNVIYENLS